MWGAATGNLSVIWVGLALELACGLVYIFTTCIQPTLLQQYILLLSSQWCSKWEMLATRTYYSLNWKVGRSWRSRHDL